jgi:hypothetical protein
MNKYLHTHWNQCILDWFNLVSANNINLGYMGLFFGTHLFLKNIFKISESAAPEYVILPE